MILPFFPKKNKKKFHRYALGVDFDAKYAAIAQELIQDKFEGEVNFDVLCVDVSKWNTEKMRGFFDVVVMNPPFGTKEQGMDYVFLTKAFEICKGNVYSFHKTCTNEVRFFNGIIIKIWFFEVFAEKSGGT